MRSVKNQAYKPRFNDYGRKGLEQVEPIVQLEVTHRVCTTLGVGTFDLRERPLRAAILEG